MGDHTAPCTDQTQAQQLCANKGSKNADAPHSHNVAHKGHHGFSHSLQHSLYDNGHTIKWFRDCNHTQDNTAKPDHLRVLREKVHHIGSKNKQSTAGQHHQRHFNDQNHPAQIPDPFFIPSSQGVACHGSCGSLHTEAGNVESGFHGIGNGMGRRGNIAQGIDHSCERHIAQTGAKTLHGIGERHLKAGLQDLPVRPDRLSLGSNKRMLPKRHGDGDPSKNEGYSTGNSRTNDPQSRSRNGNTKIGFLG